MNNTGTNAALMEEAGAFLGRLDGILDGFDHAGAHRTHMWDLQNTGDLSELVHVIADPKRRALVEGVIAEFRDRVVPRADGLRKGILQADFNDANVVIVDGGSEAAKVSGVIDFGDIVHSYRVNDVAIGMAYSMVTKYGQEAPFEAPMAFFRGFAGQYPVDDLERELLWILVACRLAISTTCGALSQQKDPDNEYLKLHAEPGWKALETLRGRPAEELQALLSEVPSSAGGGGGGGDSKESS
eukprot:g1726.t1